MAMPDRSNLNEHQRALMAQVGNMFGEETKEIDGLQDHLPEEVLKMRIAAAAHHTNTQLSRTSEYWRATSSVEEYNQIQAKRRAQKNIPTTSSDLPEEHMIIANRIAAMEKRRVGTKFLDREVTEADQAKGLIDMCTVM